MQHVIKGSKTVKKTNHLFCIYHSALCILQQHTLQLITMVTSKYQITFEPVVINLIASEGVTLSDKW